MRLIKVGCVKKDMEVSEFGKEESVKEYQENAEGEWNTLKDQKNGDVKEEWQPFKKVVVSYAGKLCGLRLMEGGVTKGNEPIYNTQGLSYTCVVLFPYLHLSSFSFS